jgi:hypothetical protein
MLEEHQYGVESDYLVQRLLVLSGINEQCQGTEQILGDRHHETQHARLLGAHRHTARVSAVCHRHRCCVDGHVDGHQGEALRFGNGQLEPFGRFGHLLLPFC